METVGDPCAVLTEEQLRRLSVNRFRPRADTGAGHRGCTFHVDAAPPWYSFTPTPNPDLDVRSLPSRSARQTKIVAAAGFPAVESRLGATGDANLSCFVNVDVADGQSLEVQSLLNSTEAFTSDEMCEKTRQVAEAAMVTLLNGR